jgi:high-affinity iron transporter
MRSTPTRTLVRLVLIAAASLAAGPAITIARAAEVSGTVVMSEVCAPEVSPAVVVLEPVEKTSGRLSAAGPAEVALVNQRGLQFVPRVQAITLGQSLRFTNGDAETHNVHILSPGNDFNQSMAPGQPRDFTPGKPGVIRLACDIHSHMRGYVVVSASPYVRVCSAKGRLRLDDVPDGRYTLTVWHEMGEPLRKPVTVAGGKDLNLDTMTLTGPAPRKLATGQAEPARTWADVIDRIGVLLSTSVDAATRTDGFKKARRVAEDAYWAEFEASDMETAVRLHLGFTRAVELERLFRAVVPAVRAVSTGETSPARAVEATRPLLLALVKAADELNRKGVTDGAHLQTTSASAPVEKEPAGVDPTSRLGALTKTFGLVRGLADKGEADEAASAMTDAYWGGFEPMERFIGVSRPRDVRPLEIAFSTLRGEVGAGLRGEPLAARLDGLEVEIKAALDRSRAVPAGAFGPAFAASLVTILREGVEVILLLTMLIALVAKTGQAGALRSIGWGVALAVLASAATALGLNMMVASATGRAREVIEGSVMLVAAGVLFYVSYWLISQSESKRWMDFLKRQAARGVALGGRGGGNLALTATAFLAVYREGAETALMYQAMIGSQAGARAGLTGLAAGLGVGLVLLAVIAYVIRATSIRLRLRAFFQVTGGVLFAMAVVFAGNGVFALQESGFLKLTPLAWLGGGLPALGIHPNLQALSVQGLLLAGAALALVVLLPGDRVEARPKAGVGV